MILTRSLVGERNIIMEGKRNKPFYIRGDLRAHIDGLGGLITIAAWCI